MVEHGAAALLGAIGLMPDGPVTWGRPVPARGPGIYVVELPAPLPSAPIELTRVGKWIEQVPGLLLDGARPTSRALAHRLGEFWWPGSTVVFAGATDGSLGGRVAALYRHVLGERSPHADGHWIHALRDLERCRLWWAATEAPEEYLDAFLDAFAGSVVPATPAPGRPAGALPLPWAVTRRPTGERQPHGITGAVPPAQPVAVVPPPGTIVTALPPGDADGATVEPKGTGTTRRAPAAGQKPKTTGSAARQTATPGRRKDPPVHLSPAAIARMEVELEELARVRRPEVVARIASARELGDLKENAEYHSAREEQSFLEGRIRTLESRLRNAVIVEEGGSGDDVAAGPPKVRLGSRVTVEQAGESAVYTIVGTTESDPANGRISSASPIGAALIGATAGTDVQVRTPRGSTTIRVVAID